MRFTGQHQRLTEELNENIQSLSIPSRLLKSRIVLIQKDPPTGKAILNYQPKASLNLLWKLKTGIIADKLYQHLENKNLLLEEQKGCRHASRGTKEAVIKNFKRRETNQNKTWVDFRKACAMVPYAWIIKALKLIGHPLPKVIALLKSTMVNLKTKLVSGDINLGEVNINRGIFQGDCSSPLLFIISVTPLTPA